MTTLKSGHVAVPSNSADDDDQRKNFKAYIEGTVRLEPKGWFFPSTFLKFADSLYEFEYKSSDVVVMTYPKCGTTWLQEIIWTMRNNPDLTNPMAGAPINVRSPFLDFDHFVLSPYSKPDDPENDPMLKMFKEKYPGIDPEKGIFLHLAKTLPEPRTIKTHLPFSLLNKKLIETAKIVYVARNPKDVCMSFFHHSRLIKSHDFTGSFDKFFEYFINDKLVYSPFWKHIEEGWNLKNHKNVHFVFYEDFKVNPKKEIERLDQFIGSHLTVDQINNVVGYTSFAAMKERDSVLPMNLAKDDSENKIFNVDVYKKDGGFFRKGEAGTWQNKLSKEQEELMNNWIKENTKDIDIQFKYK